MILSRIMAFLAALLFAAVPLRAQTGTPLPVYVNGQVNPSLSAYLGGPGSGMGFGGVQALICSANQFFTGLSTGGVFSCAATPGLASQAANTLLGNASGSAAVPSPISVPSCSAGGNALGWTSGSGFNCATGLAVLATADQVQAGGATLTAYSIGTQSSGTYTIDCGKNPVQFLTNAGAFTLAAPANDGACLVQVINGASAGAVSLSGFATSPSGTGDTFATTNGTIFTLNVFRINGTATAIWKQQQ